MFFRALIRRDQERKVQPRTQKEAIQDGLRSGIGQQTVKELCADAE